MELSPLKIDRKKRDYRATPGGGPGKSLLAWMPWLALAVAAWVLWTPLSRAIDRLRLIEVQVTRVRSADPVAAGAVRGTAANGYIVAARRAALSADTPGRVVEVLVEEGSVVKTGDVIARLYDDEYEAALRRTEATILSADAGIARAHAEVEAVDAELGRYRQAMRAAEARVTADSATLRLAESELERFETLEQGGASTARELDQAREAAEGARARHDAILAELDQASASITTGQARLEVARHGIAQAEAERAVAVASRDQAQATLDKTVVRAPFDGIVVLKDAEVGEVVSPNSQGGSNARGSICTMVDFSSLEVQVDVTESSLPAVRIGAPVTIFVDAAPGRTYRGRVSRIWPTANRQKASVEVRVTFDSTDSLLRPDLGVRVVFDAEDGDAGAAEGAPSPGADAPLDLLVPETSIVRIAGRPGVFVLERDRVTFRPLELGAQNASTVIVLSGVEAGERIVIAPPPSLEDGERVRVAGD